MHRLKGILLVASCGCAVFSGAQTWNLADDFSTTSNPLGQWTYGYGSNFLDFHAYDEFMYGWNNSPKWQRQGLDLPTIWKNTYTAQGYGVNPGEVSLHPLTSDFKCAVQWTAPNAGQFRAVGAFGKGDNGVVDCSIYQNFAERVHTGPIAGDSFFDVFFTAQQGDSLRFYVDNYDGYGYDNTPLILTITTVPEPASLAVLGLGALALIRRRRA